jgi:hypothetical protein
MEKRNKIIYWIFTLWMGLGWTSFGIIQVLQTPDEVARITKMGFPAYVLPLLGACKLLGVAAALAPRLPTLKEWAYAGFFFTLVAALYAHIAISDPIADMIPAMLLLVLTTISYYFRPADRKITASK